jgi:GTP-binding protein HflX
MHTTKRILRVLPIYVINPRKDKEIEIYIGEELDSLIATLGGTIVDRVIQKLERPNNATFIGSGKVHEVTEVVKEKNVDVVILSTFAKPRQIHGLKTAFHKVMPGIDVWDRVDLILQIFDKHASTTEAKLQIELARMRYMGPRIYGMGFVMSQQGGGIGTLGIGETNTELMKRHWRNEMKQVTDKLDKIAKNHKLQLEKRKRSGYKSVSIVGYTNAGKSSLFRLLTGKKTLVENELFATLDSAIGTVFISALESDILITDTIGFIRDLPPRLIDAFKSTLMESVHADLLLHVIDASDPEIETKMTVVNGILQDLKLDPDNALFVFNKIDAPGVDSKKLAKKYAAYSPIFVSVKENRGVEHILHVIGERLLQNAQQITS